MNNITLPALSPVLAKNLEHLAELTSKTGHFSIPTATIAYFVSRGIDSYTDDIKIVIPVNGEPRQEVITGIRNYLESVGLSFLYTTSSLGIVTNDTDILGIARCYFKSTHCMLIVTGYREYVELAVKGLATVFDCNVPPTIKVGRIDSRGELSDTEALATVREYTDTDNRMYPYFDVTPEQMWRDFKASDANVLLLIGSWGTGKSNYITRMVAESGWSKDICLYDREDVILHPKMSEHLRGMPAGSVVIMEDADKLISKRSDDNENIAAVLNLTSGIATSDVKIIITTNLPNLKSVDPALLRPGRTFKVLEFKALTIEQAHALRDKMSLPRVDFGNLEKISMAEAINWDPNEPFVRDTTVGFL